MSSVVWFTILVKQLHYAVTVQSWGLLGQSEFSRHHVPIISQGDAHHDHKYFSSLLNTWPSSSRHSKAKSMLLSTCMLMNLRQGTILLRSFCPSSGSWPSRWTCARPHLIRALTRSGSLMSRKSICRKSSTLSRLMFSQPPEASAASVSCFKKSEMFILIIIYTAIIV